MYLLFWYTIRTAQTQNIRLTLWLITDWSVPGTQTQTQTPTTARSLSEREHQQLNVFSSNYRYLLTEIAEKLLTGRWWLWSAVPPRSWLYNYLGVSTVIVADKGKPSRSACAPLTGDVDVSHITVLLKQRLQVLQRSKMLLWKAS